MNKKSNQNAIKNKQKLDIRITLAIITLVGTLVTAISMSPVLLEVIQSSSPTLTLIPPTITDTEIPPTITNTPIISVTADTASTVFTEDLSLGTKYWPVEEFESDVLKETRMLSGEFYQWNVEAKKSVLAFVSSKLPPASNFEFEIKLRQTRGMQNLLYGIMFRNNEKGFYLFQINGQGKCRFVKWVAEAQKYTWIIPETNCQINSNEFNTLKVVAINDMFQLSVNGLPVTIGNINDDEFSIGTIGIVAGLSQESILTIEMSEFILRSR